MDNLWKCSELQNCSLGQLEQWAMKWAALLLSFPKARHSDRSRASTRFPEILHNIWKCGHCLSWKQRQSSFLIQLSPELSIIWIQVLLHILKTPLCIDFLPWGKPEFITSGKQHPAAGPAQRWDKTTVLQVSDLWFLHGTTDQNHIVSTVSWWHLASMAVLVRGGSPRTLLTAHGRDVAAGKAAH